MVLALLAILSFINIESNIEFAQETGGNQSGNSGNNSNELTQDITSDGNPSNIESGISEDILSLIGGTGITAPITSRLAPVMAMDVIGAGRSNGTQVKLWSRHDGINQQFTWQPSGEILVYGNMCLDAAGGNGNDGDRIVIWTCHGGPNQRWTATAAGEIRGINGKCIDVFNSNTTNGTDLILWPCTGGLNQKWDNSSAPTPTPTPTPTGVPIYPGQSIQATVNANPAGTAFVIKAGTHTQQRVIPKSGNTFVGEPNAVLDGQGVTPYAFTKGPAPYPSNVTIRGLKITNYNPPMQTATVDAGGYYPNEGTTGWVIDDNEVSYNGEYGIRIGNSTRVTNNNAHHNKRLNIAGTGNNTVIEGNEIAYGNYLNSFNTNFEAGGTKFGYTDGLVLRDNYVHDNLGVGLHMDENNINTLIELNRIINNGSEGIAIEISYATRILNNTITGNGWNDPRNRYTYLWNAGIGVHASPNVEVAGNTVSGNYAGIVAIQQYRGSDRADYGPHVVQNFYVHDNVITQTNLPRTINELSVAAGAAQDIGDTSIFTSRNNRFVNNTYYMGSNPRPFAWMNGTRTEFDWRGYGLDVGGIFNR